MNIIIPLGGKGERFQKEGYNTPKPLIMVGHKEMIRYVIDNLVLREDDTISILYYEKLDRDNFSAVIKKYYPDVKLVPIPFQTRGAVETIDYGLRCCSKNFQGDKKCLLLDCDAFYLCDVLEKARQCNNNGVFVFQEEDPIGPVRFSYVSVDENNDRIMDVAEKSRISQYANTGAYLFENVKTLLTYTKKVLDEDFTYYGEFYTSCVIKQMLKEKHIFRMMELPKTSFVSLGTPEQLKEHLSGCYSFLFDLDGTLVDTTDIYVKVWGALLEPFNANVDHLFFKTYIDGNNDEMVMKMLMPLMKIEDMKELSRRKDELFLEFIDELKVVEGVKNFIREVRKKGHFVGIVTNCNRKVAEHILDYSGIGKLIDILVIGNECVHPKPYPDPYETAKQQLGVEKVIIFEDSCPGLLSARGVFPECIVGVDLYRNNECVLKQYGAHRTIYNFQDITIPDILGSIQNNLHTLEQTIKESIKGRFVDIDRVIILSNKLKGGYIADVLRVDLLMKDGKKLECVAKLQSETTSNLSEMAIKLNLYKREQYFYESIRDHIPIKAPMYYGTIRNNNLKPMGVLLEYMPPEIYRMGVDLEKEPIDTTLKLIKNIASHHARFWGKNLVDIFPQLTKNNDPIFNPEWDCFVRQKWSLFKEKWCVVLTKHQLEIGDRIVASFDAIQKQLSVGSLTLCHGDVKSPNIFFNDENEPVFIDWQYIVAGKGVQDLVFLMIESFSPLYILKAGDIFKEYYYLTLVEEGVEDYSHEAYNKDFQMSICYFPFFVAVWFGTTPTDQLIDVNFPFFFIQKLFSFIEKYLNENFFSQELQH